MDWCNRQHGIYHRETDGVPQDIHYENYAKQMRMLEMTPLLLLNLCPECWISFDDFVNYEGLRFGVSYSYRGSTARIMRKDDRIYIYSADMKQLPMPVRTEIVQLPAPETALSFEKFNFDTEVKWDD